MPLFEAPTFLKALSPTSVYHFPVYGVIVHNHTCTGADSGGGAPSAPPPPKKKEERERERERERGSKEETIRSIRGKTSAEAFVISF